MKLQLQHISKSFPGVKALDDVTLTFKPGDVHAICGENGAGKSTLLNIITGNLTADEGTILIDDTPVSFSSPRQAFESGIAIVYQHLSLVDSLSIAENIFAGAPPVNRYGFIQRAELFKKTTALLQKLELTELRAHQLVQSLSAGQKQMVEIAKALAGNPQIVFFDEPTASVSEKDVQVLFRIIQQLKKEGTAIVYISHRLPEIFALANVITVLKDGKSQGTYETSTLHSDQLIRLMVGRDINTLSRTSTNSSTPLLEVKNLSGKGFTNINFTLHKGEILGLAGLIGAGRTEIAKAIFGAEPADSGSIKINNKPVQLIRHPATALRLGIGYVPEDRKSQGIFPDKSVAENIYVTTLASSTGFHPVTLKALARNYIQSLNIRTPSVEKNAGELSGGNQQKVLLARWLQTNPDILLLDEPTHGIDVGAKFEIYQLIHKLAEEGKGILLISSEMTELLHLCHRIMVIKEGTCVDVLDAAQATEEKILSLSM